VIATMNTNGKLFHSVYWYFIFINSILINLNKYF
jgi:hypothetical protein